MNMDMELPKPLASRGRTPPAAHMRTRTGQQQGARTGSDHQEQAGSHTAPRKPWRRGEAPATVMSFEEFRYLIGFVPPSP